MMDSSFWFLIPLFGFALLPCVWSSWVMRNQDTGPDSQEDYFRTHPPISDEEYLALCDPSVPAHVCLKVRQIFSEVSGIDRELIYPDARTVADLGME